MTSRNVGIVVATLAGGALLMGVSNRGYTMGLLGMALQSQLNQRAAAVSPSTSGSPTTSGAMSRQACRELAQAMFARSTPAMRDQPDGLASAIGGTARTIVQLGEIKAELERRGCPTDGRASDESERRYDEGLYRDSYQPRPRIQPGKPMMDARPTLDVSGDPPQ